MSKIIASKAGHRGRMRERVLAHGAETLADYELLEVLLFYAIPRKDTKPLAKTLLAQFGSLGALMQAKPEQLRDSGLSDRMIDVLHLPIEAAHALMSSDEDTPLHLGNSTNLMRYVKGGLQRLAEPRIGVLYLDSNNHLLREGMLPAHAHLSESHQHIARELLHYHATALIIVYYHPRSPAIAFAPEVRGLKYALAALAVTVHEAILIGEGWLFSMNEEGLLQGA